MDWIEYSKQKPNEDMAVLVINVYKPYDIFQATYRARDDVFVLYDPERRRQPCIAVTHWLKVTYPDGCCIKSTVEI